MPEGDTLYRTAAGLRPFLLGRVVTSASVREPGAGAGARVDRIVGSEVTGVDAQGKNLLIRFANGLEIRTHLGMHGSWHRYRPGERWKRPAARARLILEVEGSVAVCFDAPTVELFEQRAEGLHGSLSALGPDLLRDPFDEAEVLRRLRDPARAGMTIAQALLDQRALAGIGNVYKSEILFIEGVSPFARVADVDDATLARLVDTARRLLRANAFSPAPGAERVTTGGARAAGGPLWVYGRGGRPCRRCGTTIASEVQGGATDLPRLTYWCPTCQPDPRRPR
jgi:endonuclease-8